jgi:hypothetical protein
MRLFGSHGSVLVAITSAVLDRLKTIRSRLFSLQVCDFLELVAIGFDRVVVMGPLSGRYFQPDDVLCMASSRFKVLSGVSKRTCISKHEVW